MSNIPSWAVRGAKVVCVCDLNARRPLIQGVYIGPYPSKGEVLTIRETRAAPRPHATFEEYSDRLGVRFIFLRPTVPIQTEADDVALFRKLLTQKSREDA